MFRSECYSVEHNCTDFHCFSRHMQSPAALSLHCSLSQNLWWQSNILPQSPENQWAQLLTVVKMSYFQFGILPGTTIFTNGIMQCMCCPISSGSDFFDFFSVFFSFFVSEQLPLHPQPPNPPFPPLTLLPPPFCVKTRPETSYSVHLYIFSCIKLYSFSCFVHLEGPL